MKYNELEEKIKKQIDQNEILSKQSYIMFIPSSHRFNNDDGKEKLVEYGIGEVYADFIFKEKKTLFLIGKYLNSYIAELDRNKNLFNMNNMSLPPNEPFDEMVYYFDSLIASLSVIVESDQKNILSKYLDAKAIKNFYPTRQRFGLWWQIYMLRNRIVHSTEARYSKNENYCSRFMDFSSRILWINTNNYDISIYSTLIDIYKRPIFRKAIMASINDRRLNPFDLLFPNKKAMGHGKNKPHVLMLDKNDYFDYATSGVNLIDEVQTLFEKINYEFMKKYSEDYSDIYELLNSKILYKDGSEYSVKDIFTQLEKILLEKSITICTSKKEGEYEKSK